MPAEIQSQAYI